MANSLKTASANSDSSAADLSQTKNKIFSSQVFDREVQTESASHDDVLKYALLSVYDKTGIVEFAKVLDKLGYVIVSTGGTYDALQAGGVAVVPVTDLTGNPEAFAGRMKTISFQIESGILYDRKNIVHSLEAEKLGIKPIDIVVCNLYPFEAEPSIENIDVGGPTMLRSAAKNHQNVLAICDPADYGEIAGALENHQISEELRLKLAQKTFEQLSFYDSQIAAFFRKQTKAIFPKEFTLPGRKVQELRYGENPHQSAALYTFPKSNSPLAKLEKHWGRDLSLVNVTDVDAGLAVVRMFEQPAAVVIKHNTPCGIALGDSMVQSLERAIEADPVSAFGGVIVMNKALDIETAKIIADFKHQSAGNIDIVASPSIEKEALDLLQSVRKSMGVYTFGPIPQEYASQMNVKSIEGGFILQNADQNLEKGFDDWEIATKVKPTDKQLNQAKIAWLFVTRIRSNCVLVFDPELPMTRGIGSGQTSRVGSTKIALDQAGEKCRGAILASDSFFPFPDSVELSAKAGIGLIIQQGDSVNDKASIEAADKAGIPMILTHRRAFWH